MSTQTFPLYVPCTMCCGTGVVTGASLSGFVYHTIQCWICFGTGVKRVDAEQVSAVRLDCVTEAIK